MFLYCKKCALIKKKTKEKDLCPACNISMSVVPSEYLSDSGNMFISQKSRIEFEETIKKGENFDPDANLSRDDIINQREQERQAEIEKKVSEYNKNRLKITCPLCHSENLSEISNLGKVVKVGVFGILGAGDIGKKYNCNSCGYKF